MGKQVNNCLYSEARPLTLTLSIIPHLRLRSRIAE